MYWHNTRKYRSRFLAGTGLILFSLLFTSYPYLTRAIDINTDMDRLWNNEQLVVEEMPWRDKGTPFGMVATLGNRVHASEMATIVQLMKEAGVQWQREEIFWHEVQQTPGGPFRWSGNEQGFYNYDMAIETQVRAGIQVLGLLDYNPAWFKGQNPSLDQWIDDWGNFVYNTVARYGRDRGWITHWELWNEPNLQPSGYESGLYTVEDYVRILQVGSAAAKAADPNATIVLGGLAPTWTQQPSPYSYDYFAYLLAIAEAGGWDSVDILAIHPYRPGPPEGAVEGRREAMDLRYELRFLDRLLVQYGPKPVWITELGWSTHQGSYSAWPPVDLDTQAFFLIRSYILAITHPSVEKVFWYDFRNDTAPADSSYMSPVVHSQEEQFHYGLLRRSYPLIYDQPTLRKPAFVAYRTLTQMLAGLAPSATLADGTNVALHGVYWYQFAGNNRRVDVVWRTSTETEEIVISCDCREAMVRHWNGELEALITTDDGQIVLSLEAPGTPLYLEYDPPATHGEQYFAATGRSIRGAFYDFWQQHGGVYRFGYPLTNEIIEPEPTTGMPRVVQYFDRARFEHHPEQSGTPYEIQLANLGHAVLVKAGLESYPKPNPSPQTDQPLPDEQLYFPQTGHTLAPPFRAIWETYGGLDMIGYPISEPFSQGDMASGRPYQVQYFERARIEVFPAYGELPAKVEFGMLSRELYTSWGHMP